MRKIVPVMVTVGMLGALASQGLAQQTQPQMQNQPSTAPRDAQGTGTRVRTIDCPPAAASSERPSGAVGTPQGAGTGSGLNAMPSVGPAQRVEGEIKSIASTRTNRIVEVGDVKLEVEPDTVILVGCQPSAMTALTEGTKIKAAYEMKEPNRNVATVIEAQK